MTSLVPAEVIFISVDSCLVVVNISFAVVVSVVTSDCSKLEISCPVVVMVSVVMTTDVSDSVNCTRLEISCSVVVMVSVVITTDVSDSVDCFRPNISTCGSLVVVS